MLTKEAKRNIQVQLGIQFTRAFFQDLGVSYEMNGEKIVIHFSFDKTVVKKITQIADECKLNFQFRANGDISVELIFYPYE